MQIPKNIRKRRSYARRYVLATLVLLLGITAITFGLHQRRRDTIPKLPEPSLSRLAAQHSIAVGNFAIRNRIYEPAYDSILSSQFDLAILDNTPNWYFTDGGLRPSLDSFSFNHMDEVVNYAESRGMPMQAHHYVWGEEKWLPEWLKKGEFTKQQLDDILNKHITTVGERYKGRIREWTVVNEAFSRGQGVNGLRDWWIDAYGSKAFIDKSFKWAREADPDSVLILNDFGNEVRNPVSDEMYAYIESARARGIPIDGLGMQMHIDGANPPSKADVVDNMKRFANIGVRVYITEFDVTMNGVAGTEEEKQRRQADIYYDMARACIESKVCDSFALLGITDKETWYNYVGQDTPIPLPFDEKYAPKPAFFALRRAFSEK